MCSRTGLSLLRLGKRAHRRSLAALLASLPQEQRPLEDPLVFGNYNVAYVRCSLALWGGCPPVLQGRLMACSLAGRCCARLQALQQLTALFWHCPLLAHPCAAQVSTGNKQAGQPAGGRFRGGLGKLLFRTTLLAQSVLRPDLVTNLVRWGKGRQLERRARSGRDGAAPAAAMPTCPHAPSPPRRRSPSACLASSRAPWACAVRAPDGRAQGPAAALGKATLLWRALCRARCLLPPTARLTRLLPTCPPAAGKFVSIPEREGGPDRKDTVKARPPGQPGHCGRRQPTRGTAQHVSAAARLLRPRR